MLAKVDGSWLLLAVVAIAMLSYFFAIGLHALLEEAAFGPVGNAAIVTFGFFGTVYAANLFGWRFSALLNAMLTGIAGAFALFSVFVLVKKLLSRLG